MTAYHHSKVDRASLRRYRLERIRRELRRRDYGGALLFDPCNIRHACDVANMQVWALHNKCRYVYVATEGPVILFDYGCARHLSEGYELIGETRSAFPHTYFTNGGRHGEYIGSFAKEVADLVHQHGGGNRRLAVDKLDPPGAHALEREGIVIVDGEEMMEWARTIKNADEIVAMKEAIAACEAGIAAMWRAAEARHDRERGVGASARDQHRPRRRVDRVPALDLGRAHQPLVPGMLRPRDPGWRHRRVRHRPHRAERLLRRCQPQLGRGRGAAERRAAAPLWRGAR